jgi:hypothetical protein
MARSSTATNLRWIGGKPRPVPPAALLDPEAPPAFAPAPELVEWALATFVTDGAPLFNPRHQHLQEARIGCLWTNVVNVSQGRRVIGRCEIPRPPARAGKWEAARWLVQRRAWFCGDDTEAELPDFELTFDARLMAEATDASFCATVEHELGHAGQARDADDELRFRRDGTPVWAIVGHTVEEHDFIVERYGSGASAAGVAAFLDAAKRGPTIAAARIAGACGTCMRGAA